MQKTGVGFLLLVSMAAVAQPRPHRTAARRAPGNAAPAAASPAAAKPLPRAQFIADMDAQFRKMDTNGDGVVTRTEVEATERANAAALATQRNRALFAELDKNHDGQLSPAEFAAMAGPQTHPDAGPILTRFDTNRDGRIGLVEYRVVTQANFDKLDVDKDGVLSLAEMRAGGIIK